MEGLEQRNVPQITTSQMQRPGEGVEGGQNATSLEVVGTPCEDWNELWGVRCVSDGLDERDEQDL